MASHLVSTSPLIYFSINLLSENLEETQNMLPRRKGGRPLGSRNKKTLARLAEAAAVAAGAADGPKAIPSLTRILRWHLDRAAGELAKPSPDPAIVSAAYAEARATAAILAPFQAPRLSAVALGQVTKMTVIVKGGLPPRDTRALPVEGHAAVLHFAVEWAAQRNGPIG
jgi:hypothetical protein